LTGLRAFRGSSTPDIFAAILRGEPDWDALPAKVPDEVRGLLQGCLQKEAAERRQNFTEIRRELASAISALPAREHGHKRFTVLVGAAPVALVALLSLIRPTLLLGFEYRVYDTVVRLSPTSPPDSRVMIVDIDDRSLAAIGQWPWRRDVVGKLVARLRSLGADAIVLEFLFAEPDRFEGSVQADGSSSNVATPDTLFAQSLRGGRVVLGNFMSFEPNSASMDECVLHPMDVATHEIEKTHPQKAPFFAATGGVCSLPVLARAAGQSGFLNGTPDPDGILRRAPLLIAFRGRLYPSAALAAVSITKAVEAAELRDRHTSNVSLTLGDLVVPLDGKSNLLLRYRGPQRTFQFISAVDVMEDKTPPQSIQGRIVFVGMSAAGSRDIVATPLDTNFLGVEMQATVADNLLQQDFVYRPLRGPWFEVLAVVASGLILTLLIAYFGLFAGVLAALAALAVFWLGSVWSLSSAGMFLSPFYPSVGVALTLLSWILGKVSIERRRAELAIRNVESAVLDR
jgi:adenylate cyclase